MIQSKALLVYPPSHIADNSVPPLGLLSIASFVNHTLERDAAEVLDFATSQLEEAKECLEDHLQGVSVVGLTVMSTDVRAALEIARFVKKFNSAILVVAGGAHATLAPETFDRPESNFDLAVLGEGELPFLEIMRMQEEATTPLPPQAFKEIPGVAYVSGIGLIHGKSSVSTPVENWSNTLGIRAKGGDPSPLTYTTPTGEQRNAVSLVTSRSCPLHCHFCSIIAMETTYRSLPPEVGIKWLQEEMQRNPFEHIYFLDADFLVSKSRATAWASAIHEAFPSVTWSVQVNVGHVIALKNQLTELRACGLVAAELGIEAGNDQQLRIFNKTNFGKFARVDQSRQAITLLQDAGIIVGIDYIMFYPELTLQELAENLSFILSSGLIDSYDTEHFATELILFPGTELRSRYERVAENPFDLDVIPDVSNFYTDPAVARIRNEFITSYSAHVHDALRDVRHLLRSTAQTCANPAARAELRLTEIILRHQPYHVLKAMILNPACPEVATRAAWQQILTAEELCRSNELSVTLTTQG